MEPHLKGDITEAIVIAELTKRGVPVSIPFGDNQRYDLIAETPQGWPLRIQIKTGWITDGVLRFKGVSQHTNSQGNKYRKYEDEVDYFIIYNHDIDQMYLVGEHEFNTKITLRIEEPKQLHDSINWAEDFEFEARWPPKTDGISGSVKTSDPLLTKAVTALEQANSTVHAPMTDKPGRRLVAEHQGEVYRLHVTSSWISDGRIQFEDRSEVPVDCYFIYNEQRGQFYVVPATEFDATITLRVEEPLERDRRMKYAHDYEFDVNWPPNSAPHPAHAINPTIREIVEVLEEHGSEVEFEAEDGTNQTLLVKTSSNNQYRIRVEEGRSDNGRVRFVPKGEDIDFYIVHYDERDECYIVGDDDFVSSFSFRVEEPEMYDPRINWAEEYLLEENWPPSE